MLFLFPNFLQPDLSGALFTNFKNGKSFEKICKKAGTEGGKSCPKYFRNYIIYWDIFDSELVKLPTFLHPFSHHNFVDGNDTEMLLLSFW